MVKRLSVSAALARLALTLSLTAAICGPAQAELAQTQLAQTPIAQTPAPPATSQTSPNDPAQTFTARLLNLFPADYASRFGSLQAFADTSSGYGVRYFPLPFKADARLTYISHPKYQEYGVSVRYQDTTFAAGRYQNDDAGATLGVAHLEVTHNPYTGWQYGGIYQDSGRSSRLNVGYAVTDGPVRLFSELGYAWQGSADAPYLHTELSGGKSLTHGPYTVGAYVTGRSYVFPQAAQFSLDVSASATIRPTDYSSFTLSQFERYATGESPIPDLAVGRYSQTNLDAVLSPNAKAGPFSLRSVEYHFQRSFLAPTLAVNAVSTTLRADIAPFLVLDLTPHHDFVATSTGFRADVFYRSPDMPVLVGPSFDYILGPGGNRWVISLKAGVK